MYAAVKTRYEVVIYQLQNIALVLDDPAPDDVVDGVGKRVGDHGGGMELLDALLGVETLPKVGWIEKKETISACFVQSHEKRSRAPFWAESQLYTPRASSSHP